MPNHLLLHTPPWLSELNQIPQPVDNDTQAMALAISAAEKNISDGGGPFGAVVVGADGLQMAVGVNRVVPGRCSILHAEMVALILAEGKLGNHNLRSAGATLYSTCAPCAMCCGALIGAGIARLVFACTTSDAETLGFDEGDKPANWTALLEARGISVSGTVLRERALALFERYRRQEGTLY